MTERKLRIPAWCWGLADSGRALLEAKKSGLEEAGAIDAAAALGEAIDELDRIAKKYEMAITVVFHKRAAT